MIGFSVSFVVLMALLSQRLLMQTYLRLCVLSLIGLALGAKLFGIAVEFLNQFLYTRTFDFFGALTTSGIVYYGGLFGYLATLFLLCKLAKLRFREIADIIAICILVFHCFGRLGCYFAGCCYGIESELFSVPYKTHMDSEVIWRMPTQLFEAAFEAFMAIALYVIYKRRARSDVSSDGNLLVSYLASYSAFRFVVEFFRGDEIRGLFFGFSFSQYVAVATLFTTVVVTLFAKKKNGMRSGESKSRQVVTNR